VNVSQRQFRQDDFVERVRAVLELTGAPADHLILEVTESLLIEDLEHTISRMTELVRMGVRFSIDDFGTGYSSLAYLKRLPLFELKIDRSFVQDTPDDPNDTAIVQSILSMASHLGLRVVAEGVETRTGRLSDRQPMRLPAGLPVWSPRAAGGLAAAPPDLIALPHGRTKNSARERCRRARACAATSRAGRSLRRWSLHTWRQRRAPRNPWRRPSMWRAMAYQGVPYCAASRSM
jgi:hypothetical protein